MTTAPVRRAHPIGEEWQELLLRLADELRPLGDPAAIMERACALLGEALAADRVNYAEVEGDEYVVANEYRREGLGSIAGRYPIASFRPAEREAFEAGRTVVIADITGEPDVSAERAVSYTELGARAFVSVPLVKEGHLVAVLSALRSRESEWTPEEVTLVEEVAERTWAAVARARVEVELRRSEERQGFLLRLSDALRPISDPVQIQGEACRILAEWLEADRAYYVEFDPTADLGRIEQDHLHDKALSMAGEHAIADFGWAVERLRRGECLVVADTRTSPLVPEADRRATLALDIIACMGAPLLKDGELVGAVCVTTSERRDWTPEEVTVLQDVAERLWAAVERARAEATLRESEERQAFLLELSDSLRPLMDAVAIQEVAMRALAERLQVVRAGYYTVDADQDTVRLSTSWEAPGAVPLPERMSIRAFGENVSEELLTGHTFVVRDSERESATEASRTAFRAVSVRALIGIPLLKGGRLLAIVAVHSRPRRDWTPAEIRMIEDAAERTWAATERALAEAALASSEARLHEFGEASSEVLWIRDAHTLEWTYLSPAFEAIYGLSREEALACNGFRASDDLIFPDDRERVRSELARVQAGDRVSFEYRVRRPEDGGVRWLRSTGFPIRDVNGRVERIGGVGHDVTEAKLAEEAMRELQERQAVLLAELQHRTRNLMTVVRALSDQTLRASASLEDFAERFDDRLGALSRANRLLSNLGEGSRVGFGELLRTELRALGDSVTTENDVMLSGPEGVALRSTCVQTLALALHELGTNAVKYGALSRPEGHLAVRWHVAREDGRPWLHIDWCETGLRDLDPSQGDGAGRELVEGALPYQLGARTTYVMEPDGVHCTIALPVSDRGRGPGGEA